MRGEDHTPAKLLGFLLPYGVSMVVGPLVMIFAFAIVGAPSPEAILENLGEMGAVLPLAYVLFAVPYVLVAFAFVLGRHWMAAGDWWQWIALGAVVAAVLIGALAETGRLLHFDLFSTSPSGDVPMWMDVPYLASLFVLGGPALVTGEVGTLPAAAVYGLSGGGIGFALWLLPGGGRTRAKREN